ncbi:hypothetical protein DXG01_004618 [Tephrocybe rancida]|nr:hypothetical protein DXG01_004618 [Tephrocybe rancida]
MSSNTITSFAVTRAINPQGATPVLTHAQVWKGLAIKARGPIGFVPIITSCEIVSDEGDKIVRKVRFNGGPEVEERIEFYGESIGYCEEERGMRVMNIVSYDAAGELQLTYTFANGIPGGSEGKSAADLNALLGGAAAEGTIKRIRQLVAEGVI